MKRVLAILTSDRTLPLLELLQRETEQAVFLGAWGRIETNKDECVRAVAAAVDHFLESDKSTVVFACHREDLPAIRAALPPCELCLLGELA